MKFIKGMDISMVKELEHYGASYRLNGKKEDLFAILKTCGANNVRIRIWPDPYDENGNSYGGGGNDLETTIEIAERTVQSGMDFMLDFHYSDFWADPAKQVKPKAWKELSGEALETAVYLHTVDTLKALKNHKLVPTMVQVGNEIKQRPRRAIFSKKGGRRKAQYYEKRHVEYYCNICGKKRYENNKPV